MSDSSQIAILRRMTGSQAVAVADPPQTWSRALRLALTKAAQDSADLSLTIMAIGDEVHELDALLDTLGSDLMLIGLERCGQPVGVIGLDVQMRAALLEMQTIGKLIGAAAETRAATGTDLMMSATMLNPFLAALPAAMAGTECDGWLHDLTLGDRFGDARAAGLSLDDGNYRALRINVDLGVADRHGQIVMALPVVTQTEEPAPNIIESPDWAVTFHDAVCGAPGQLDALLHRMTVPLGQARNLAVGQVLPLRGCTVNSVRLQTHDGQVVAQAKLGQFGGMRAVRIEAAPAPHLLDLPQPSVGDEAPIQHALPATSPV
ncbi:FliM/FliN family flagellar motor C-terminal domain-containing protein [Yoonia sp. 2307UL14-13]|uniref:FliM/FliN family flagellar motor C-terminal domain-containing protein n=1 Tax=Yoonia sp. 2307UL14-13 TaxID=3126506 RepID=UPI0030A90818